MKIKEIVSRFTQTHWLFVAVALVFGVILISLTPPLWGADECRHFFKAYQIGSGQLYAKKQIVNGIKYNDGNVPASFDRLVNLFAKDVSNKKPGDTWEVDSVSAYQKISGVHINQDSKVPNKFGAIIYPPITYTAPAIGIAIASLFNPTVLSLIYTARIATLLVYILLVFLAIFIVRKKSVRWIIFVVALLPMSLYQASVVGADSLLLGLSLIFMSCAYEMVYLEKINKRQIAVMVGAACLLSYIKPPYVILILSLVFLPLKKELPVVLRRIIRFGVPILCIVIAALAALSAISIVSSTPPPLSTSISGQVGWIFSHPLGYVYTLVNSITVLDWIPQTIGIFGTSFIYMPGPVIDTFLVLLVLMAFIKTTPINTNKKTLKYKKIGGLAFLIAGLTACIAVVTTLYLTWTPVGNSYIEGVQGRYFLPMIGFLLVGLRMLTNARLVVTEKNARIFITATVVLSLLYAMLWYYRILY